MKIKCPRCGSMIEEDEIMTPDDIYCFGCRRILDPEDQFLFTPEEVADRFISNHDAKDPL